MTETAGLGKTTKTPRRLPPHANRVVPRTHLTPRLDLRTDVLAQGNQMGLVANRRAPVRWNACSDRTSSEEHRRSMITGAVVKLPNVSVSVYDEPVPPRVIVQPLKKVFPVEHVIWLTLLS